VAIALSPIVRGVDEEEELVDREEECVEEEVVVVVVVVEEEVVDDDVVVVLVDVVELGLLLLEVEVEDDDVGEEEDEMLDREEEDELVVVVGIDELVCVVDIVVVLLLMVLGPRYKNATIPPITIIITMTITTATIPPIACSDFTFFKCQRLNQDKASCTKDWFFSCVFPPRTDLDWTSSESLAPDRACREEIPQFFCESHFLETASLTNNTVLRKLVPFY
jgi:hypothetical protein